MTEAIVEAIVESNVEKSDPPEPIIQEPQASPAEPKKKGRLSGAKDKTPRKKKITIIEEPLEQPPPPPPPPPPEPVEAPKQRVKPAPKALPRLDVSFEEPARVEEPDTPRTVMRTASISILQLRDLTERAKKSHLQEAYTKKLHRL